METADEPYKAELQKFKEKMNETIKDIRTLEYVLEYGYFENDTVDSVLKRYGKVILNDIKNAFSTLDKNAGDFKVNKQASATTNFA
jgi:hypothetical protein